MGFSNFRKYALIIEPNKVGFDQSKMPNPFLIILPSLIPNWKVLCILFLDQLT
jgi:hypothetical protein